VKKTQNTHELSFLFYQFTSLSSHAVDNHQMYSGCSVVGKASTIGIEIIARSPSPNFHRGRKVRNLASFAKSLKFKPFQVIQGHRGRYQSKARMRLPINQSINQFICTVTRIYTIKCVQAGQQGHISGTNR